MKNEFSLIIAGDFFLTDEFNKENLITDKIINIFKDANFRIVNFEAPIVKEGKNTPILKTGPNLCMKQDVAIPVLKQMNVDLLTLANNHIMDFGVDGLRNTFDVLNCNSIDYVGAGMLLDEAEKPYLIKGEGFNISILNFAENEWSSAEVDKPGANPLDIISNVNQIKKAKATSDYVIVIIHGGHEYYHYPGPRMVKQYRFYAENGADAIVGHHTHCIGGYEVYKDVPIFYSLGNFLFTLPSNEDMWYTGLLAKLYISKNNRITFELSPVQQHSDFFNVKLIRGEEKVFIFEKIAQFNNIIEDHTLLQKKWNEFIIERTKSYLQSISPINGIGNGYIGAALNKLGIDKPLLNKNNMKLLLNLIRCEAHADVTKEVISNYLDNMEE